MNRKASNLCLAIPAVLLALLVGVLMSVNVARLSRNSVARFRRYVVRYLGDRDTPSVSPVELNLTLSITSTQVVQEMLEQVDRDRALYDLRRLTGEKPICVSTGCYTITNRLTGGEGLGWEMDYLYEDLVALGYSVESKEWSQSGYTDRNLIARKTGVLTPTEEIYLVAHADGVKGSEERYPAADDNASSVVNSLELARIFSQRSFDRTLVLFFSTGEEQGQLGVKNYLARLTPSELGVIKYVINRDVTGYDLNDDRVMELGHGDHPPSVALAQFMSAIIGAYQLDLDPHVIASCP